jgi:hypothetical protein
MPRTVFIPVSEFAPDSIEWDSPALNDASNLLPVYGGQRVMRDFDVRAVKAAAGGNYPPNGSHSHLVSVDQAAEIVRPNADNSGDSEWVNAEFTNLNTPDPDDDTYMSLRDASISGGFDAIHTINDPVNTPGTGTQTIRARYRTTDAVENWQIDFQVQEESAGWVDIAGFIATDSGTTTQQTDWKTISDTVTHTFTGDALRIKTTFTGDDVTTGDAYGTDDVDGATWSKTESTYWESVDDLADDTEFVTSPGVLAGVVDDTHKLTLGLEDITYIPGTADTINNVTVRCKHDGASGNMVVHAQIVDDDDEDVSSSDSQTVSTSYANLICSCDTPLTIDNFNKLRVKVWAENIDAVGSGSQSAYPNGSTNTNSWSFDGGSLHAALGASSDEVYKTTGSANQSFIASYGSQLSEPSDHTQTRVVMRAKVSTAEGNPDFKIDVLSPSGSILQTKTWNGWNTSYQTATWTIKEDTSKNIDWSNVRLKVRTGTGVTGKTYTIEELKITAQSTAPKMLVSGIKVAYNDFQGVDVSWMEVEMDPGTNNPAIGDVNYLFIGERSSLWTLNDNDFTSIATGFATTVLPPAWDFSSWGSDVYMTNYVDDVVLWTPSSPGSVTDPAITGGDISPIPKAKFIKSVGDHMVLGNINHANYESYTVLFSHFNDPQSYSAGDIGNQSDFQNLVNTPGEITGMIGGEYGLIFKRNSIYRMSYVGPDIIFRFDLISKSVGTPYHKSVVQVGNDTYFFNPAGFFVMRGGGPPEPIGDGKITKYITDLEFESNSITSEITTDPSVNDNNVVGAYHPASQLLLWIYRSKNSAINPIYEYLWYADFMLMYNPRENRWGIATLPGSISESGAPPVGSGYTQLTTNLNLESGVTYITRGINLIGWESPPVVGSGHDITVSEFRKETNRGATITTSVLSGRSFKMEPEKNYVLSAVRPIFYGTPAGSFAPTVSFTIRSFDSPTGTTTIRTQSVVNSQAGDEGWYTFDPHTAQYMDMDFSILSGGYDFTSKDIVGFEFQVSDSTSEW